MQPRTPSTVDDACSVTQLCASSIRLPGRETADGFAVCPLDEVGRCELLDSLGVSTPPDRSRSGLCRQLRVDNGSRASVRCRCVARQRLLDDRVALITGSGSGQGRAAAVLFAEQGARVAIIDIDDAGAAETMRVVEGKGAEAIALHADVATPK